jgi:hypothetical protein
VRLQATVPWMLESGRSRFAHVVLPFGSVWSVSSNPNGFSSARVITAFLLLKTKESWDQNGQATRICALEDKGPIREISLRGLIIQTEVSPTADSAATRFYISLFSIRTSILYSFLHLTQFTHLS